MSIDTITINLDPSDVVITSTMDPHYGPQYTITLEKSKAAFLANFMLQGLNPADQARIPVGIKEDIVRSTGLKYVFRLPAITRTLLVGTAAGIALKTFSDGLIPQYILDKAPNLVAKGIEVVKLNPYLTAGAITAGALVSTIVSQEMAQFVSDVLEGTKSAVKKTASFGLSCIKAVGNFCYENPKTSTAVGSAGLGVLSWFKIPSVQKAVGDVCLAVSNISKKMWR